MLTETAQKLAEKEQKDLERKKQRDEKRKLKKDKEKIKAPAAKKRKAEKVEDREPKVKLEPAMTPEKAQVYREIYNVGSQDPDPLFSPLPNPLLI